MSGSEVMPTVPPEELRHVRETLREVKQKRLYTVVM
jgi:hypothetical protein